MNFLLSLIKSSRFLLLISLSFISITEVFSQESDYWDVVYLKNGSIIKGFYFEYYPHDSLRMKTIDGGLLICSTDDIDRIAKERVSMYVLKENKKTGNYRSKGYQGFVEYSLTKATKYSDMRGTILSTTHGYQFNSHLFVGLGASYNTVSYDTDKFSQYQTTSVSLFGSSRYYLSKRGTTPFINLSYGYSVVGNKGFIIAPSAGMEFALTRNFGVFISAGYLSFNYLKEDDQTTEDNEHIENIFINFGIHF